MKQTTRSDSLPIHFAAWRAVAATILLMVCAAAFAQPPGFVSILGLTPDPSQGGEIATSQCASCHGADGNHSMATYPRLAGQIQEYLVIQLWNFREGGRSSDIMVPMASGLSDQDIANLAAYFAQQSAMSPPYEPEAPDLVEQGSQLFALGNHESGVIACSICHGMNGQGAAQLGIPRIMGQSPQYVRGVLDAFAGLPNLGIAQPSAMTLITRNMTEEEMDAVTAFLSSQPWGTAP